MSKLFISHSSQDDAFVRGLQQALGDLKQDVWIDSRELSGGDLLWPEIQKAIENASAYAIVVSTDGLQSKWVGKELRHALDVQKQRGKDRFPVIPLSLNGTKLGVLEEFFGEEPVYISVSSAAGGIDAALNAILVAMGKRLPADVSVAPQPKADPLEELMLELTDLKFHEQDGVRRASARARLVYEPATLGQREVASTQLFRNMPARQTQKNLKTALAARLGDLPAEPETASLPSTRLARLESDRASVGTGQSTRLHLCAARGTRSADDSHARITLAVRIIFDNHSPSWVRQLRYFPGLASLSLTYV